MSALLPAKQPLRRPIGSPLPSRLAIPTRGSSPPPPPPPTTFSTPAAVSQSSASAPTKRPALSIAAVSSTPSFSCLAPSSTTLSSGSSLYPTTVTSFDAELEDGGRIADPGRIIGDIQKAMGSLGVGDLGSRSRSGSTNSLRPKARKASVGGSSNAVDQSSTIIGQPASARSDEGVDIEVDIEPGDLVDIKTLGEGAGGEVKQVLHKPSGLYMAKKTIPTSPNPVIHRQILRELAFNRTVSDGRCPNLVKYYGAFLEQHDTQIAIVMELCEGGSLEAIYKRIKTRGGRVGEKILGRIAVSVLEGLNYLHQHNIVHRDVKPSNILVTRDGQFKLCDLGVSGELIGSLAGTFMGTSAYMAPERIRGVKYSIRADVWSLGLSLLELALNRFPLAPDGVQLQAFELLQTVITFQIPSLTEEEDRGVKWTKGLRHFIGACLEKDALKRPSPKDLLNEHPWVQKSKTWSTDTAAWVQGVWDGPV